MQKGPMAVLIEPPRARPTLRETARYPGLTPEERGFDALPISVPPTDPEPPPPLWVVPSDQPRASPTVGFVAALPETAPQSPPEPDGLFDVPGLLERLWLARALEARRDRAWATIASVARGAGQVPPPSTPAVSQSGAIATPASPGAPAASVPARKGADAAPVRESPSTQAPVTVVPPAPVPFERSWVCPYCYLANNASAATCRGCGKGGLPT